MYSSGSHWARSSLRLLSVICFIVTVLKPLAARAVANPDAEAILAAADAWRSPAEPTWMKLTIVHTRSGVEETRGAYDVRTDEKGNSLVTVQSGINQGQRILSNENGLYFYAPRTRRAIRITPLQQLQGDVNIGDVANLRWSRSYEATLDSVQPELRLDNVPCWHLHLAARNATATYKSIELFVARSDGHPVRAEHHVSSGRLLATVSWDKPAEVRGTKMLRIATYQSDVDRTQSTRIEIEDVEAKDFPGWQFTLQALDDHG